MKKVKLFFKKALIIYLIVLVLLPSLFTGVALAEEVDVQLTPERAGNYAANFAINFYENWSNITVVKDGTSGDNISKSFAWPLDMSDPLSVMTSDYGQRPGEFHNGIDFGISEDTNLYASADGVATIAYNGSVDTSGYGKYVVLMHSNGIFTLYGHLHDVKIKEGDQVKQGDLIALSGGATGNTGNSTGAHLHFEMLSQSNEGLEEGEYHEKTMNLGSGNVSKYTVDPKKYVDGVITSSTKKKYKTYGKIKTVYSDDAPIHGNIEEGAKKYEMNNISWINFVYRNSLSLANHLPIQAQSINTDCYPKLDLKNLLHTETDEDDNDDSDVSGKLTTSETEDVYRIVSEGYVVPGDIIVATNGIDRDQKEYLLYVGGTKVIYATKDMAEGQGALKYEYLQYYIKALRDDLKDYYRENMDIPEDADDKKINEELEKKIENTEYGIIGVYRVGGQLMDPNDSNNWFTTIHESDTNLFFNGKGFFNPEIKYIGIPQDMAYDGSTHTSLFKWLVNFLWQIIKFIIELILFVIRAVIVGWINLVEAIIQSNILSLGGSIESKGSTIDKATGFSAITDISDRVTIESLFFNEVPITDANFFNYETAGKYSLVIKDEQGDVTVFKRNLVYQLRKNLASIYFIIRNLSIAIMLFILVYLGIRLALTTIAEKKADYKKLLIDWVVGFVIIMFIHIGMFVILNINQSFVDMCKDLSVKFGSDISNSVGEMSLYEAVRTKAYAFGFMEGTAGTIIYGVLVYLLLRYILVYFRRYITIYILALSGSFMGLKYALDKINGKKTTSFGKWLKEFSCNVALQSVHALLYVVLMTVALKMVETSFAGVIFALIVLNVMVNSDKIFMKIFGIDKPSSLADVNKRENPWEIFYRFRPIYVLGKGIVGKTGSVLVKDLGLFSRTRFKLTGELDIGKGLFANARMAETLKDKEKDAKKEILKRRYAKIGEQYRKREEFLKSLIKRLDDRKIGKLPIRVMSSIVNSDHYRTARLLGLSGNSFDTQKAIAKNFSGLRASQFKRYKRVISTPINMLKGGAMLGVGLGQLVESENPTAGILTTISGFKTLNSLRDKGHGSLGNEYYKAKEDSYTSKKYKEGVKKKLESKLNESENAYRNKLNSLNGVAGFGDLSVLINADLTPRKDGRTTTLDREKEAKRVFKELRDRVKTNGVSDGKKQIKELEELREKYIFDKEAYERAVYQDVDIKDRMFKNLIGADMKDAKAIDDARKRIGMYEDFVKTEQSLNTTLKELRQKTLEYARANGISEEVALLDLKRQVSRTFTESKKEEISSSTIKTSIAEFLATSHKEKISPSDFDAVIDIIERRVNSSSSNSIEFSDAIRNKIKSDIESEFRGKITKEVQKNWSKEVKKAESQADLDSINREIEREINEKMNSGFSKKDIAASMAVALSDGGIRNDVVSNGNISEAINDAIDEKILQVYNTTNRELSRRDVKIDMSDMDNILDNIKNIRNENDVLSDAMKDEIKTAISDEFTTYQQSEEYKKRVKAQMKKLREETNEKIQNATSQDEIDEINNQFSEKEDKIKNSIPLKIIKSNIHNVCHNNNEALDEQSFATREIYELYKKVGEEYKRLGGYSKASAIKAKKELAPRNKVAKDSIKKAGEVK